MPDEPWEKVLWKKQPYPDNYVPEGLFLSSLRRNPNFRPYTYWQLVFLSFAITQHLASVAIFVSAFTMLKDHVLDPRVLLWLSIAGFFLGYFVWEVLVRAISDRARRREDRMRAVKASILLFLALMCLAPVLRTLTAATSSDSIWAMAAALFILNALLADYTPMPGHARERLTSVLSTNAAISSSVVLASRLAHDLAVFALTLFAVEVFALFPMLRRRLQTTPAPVQAGLTVALVLLALSLSARVSATAPWLYAAIFTFVTFAAPAMLVWAQQYKKYVVYPICRTRTSRPRLRANEDLCTAKSADNGTLRCPKSSSIWPQTSRPHRSSRRIIYSTSIVPSGSGSHTDRSHSFCPPPKPYNLPTRSLRRATNSRTVQGPAACQST